MDEKSMKKDYEAVGTDGERDWEIGDRRFYGYGTQEGTGDGGGDI